MCMLSVIIPIYNVEAYLHQCIESVLGQDFKDIEVILVDDGSPDGSPAICDEYAVRDTRVKVIHKLNGGLSSARNAGMRSASGKYICFLDSDDYWNEHVSLHGMIDYAEKANPFDLLFFNSLDCIEDAGLRQRRDSDFIVGLNKRSTWQEQYQYLVESGNIHESACTKLLNRKFLLDNQLFFREGMVCEDSEWILRLYCRNPRVLALDQPLIICRSARPGSISTCPTVKSGQALLLIIEDHMNDTQSPTAIRKLELAHCAYLWFTCLGIYAQLDKPSQKNIIGRIKACSRIASCGLSRKTHIVYRVYRILGFHLTAYLLGVYYRMLKKEQIPYRRKKVKC